MAKYVPPSFASLPAPALHVRRFFGGEPSVICKVTIIRQTRTLWIDNCGGRWKKSTGECSPSYLGERWLMAEEVPHG